MSSLFETMKHHLTEAIIAAILEKTCFGTKKHFSELKKY